MCSHNLSASRRFFVRRSHDLRREDGRTMHEALPPTAGLKISANLWLHQYDFRGPNIGGCDMGKFVDRKALRWPSDDEALAEHTARQTGWPTLPDDDDDADADVTHVENDEL